MSWESLIAFNAVLIAAIASPGAALLYFIKTTVASGRLTGIAVGIGLGTAAAGWTLAALLGLESLFRLFPWTYTILKVGGAAYLIYLAVQTWRQAKAPLGEAAALAATEGPPEGSVHAAAAWRPPPPPRA